jgi:hypothetical protein
MTLGADHHILCPEIVVDDFHGVKRSDGLGLR